MFASCISDYVGEFGSRASVVFGGEVVWKGSRGHSRKLRVEVGGAANIERTEILRHKTESRVRWMLFDDR